MSQPELDLVQRLIERLARLRESLRDDLAWLEELPVDRREFETMASHRRSAARAALKSFEQIEYQLSRAFRALPLLLAEDSQRWFARDHADFMEQLGVLDSAAAWMPVVRLRNKLVHDYPLDPQVQYDRFIEAMSYAPLLDDIFERLSAFVRDVLPGKLP